MDKLIRNHTKIAPFFWNVFGESIVNRTFDQLDIQFDNLIKEKYGAGVCDFCAWHKQLRAEPFNQLYLFLYRELKNEHC